MILSAVIGVSLVSYLQLARTSLEVSNRGYYSNAAMNLAENGLEEVMYALNQYARDPAYAWTGWSIEGGNAWRQFPTSGSYELDRNATGFLRVYVDGYLNPSPVVTARATVTLAGTRTPPVEKWVEVRLSRTSKFANGLVASQSIQFKGSKSTVDSWDSDPDRNPATAAVPYSAGVRRAAATVGSGSVGVDAILVNNADIWGYASTGGAPPKVGSQGLVGPFGTTVGTMNPNHISNDFVANLEPVTDLPPTGTILAAISANTELPRAGDQPVMVNGVPAYCYTANQISLSSAHLRIRPLTTDGPPPNVVITLTNPTTCVTISGNSGIIINSGASLQLYAPGDVKIAGNGTMNGGNTTGSANQPIAFQLWGTRPNSSVPQSIDVVGNGVLSGVVYAPNAEVAIKGNGDILGAVVARNITLVGNADFHYDESLANFGPREPYRVNLWLELSTAEERAARAKSLSF